MRRASGPANGVSSRSRSGHPRGFVDSWVWIEFFAEDDRWRDAQTVLERVPERGAVVAPTVLMEVRCRIGEKYRQGGERELSDADAIHLAIAVMTGCETLYSGDPDFAGLYEIEII